MWLIQIHTQYNTDRYLHWYKTDHFNRDAVWCDTVDIYTSTQERKWQWPGMMFTVSHTGVTYRYIYTYRYGSKIYTDIRHYFNLRTGGWYRYTQYNTDRYLHCYKTDHFNRDAVWCGTVDIYVHSVMHRCHIQTRLHTPDTELEG